MIKLLTFLCIILLSAWTKAQSSLNWTLKNELDSIYNLDQKYRVVLFSEALKSNPDSIAKSYGIAANELQNFLMTQMMATDSANIVRIDEIIKNFGYPGKTLVGEPTNEAAFMVIQHSQSINKFLPSIKTAAHKKELPFLLYAMMLDRSLMYAGKEQIYGTQGSGFQILNITTGQKEFKMVIWPIKNYKEVNKRRKEGGFKETVEENAKRLGITYKHYTIEEINKIKVN
jgi:hypothetical protein